jgi:hypothetical protein
MDLYVICTHNPECTELIYDISDSNLVSVIGCRYFFYLGFVDCFKADAEVAAFTVFVL